MSRKFTIEWFLFLCLFLAFEIYYFIFIPNPLNIKMYFKLLILFYCLLFSIIRLLGSKSDNLKTDYVIITLFILSVAASSLTSLIPIYSAIQSLLLTSLIIVTIYSAKYIVSNKDILILSSITKAISIIVVGSLFLYLVYPASYSVFLSGHTRVTGVFGRSSHMAIMCGLAIGLSLHLINNKIIKYMVVLFSLILLYLTGSRTPVVALPAVSLFYILILYKGKLVFRVAIIAFFVCAIGLTAIYKITDIEQTHYIRESTLNTMSGRTLIWKYAITRAISKPLGCGYGLGGSILQGTEFMPMIQEETITSKGDIFSYSENRHYKSSLHSGYVQALADFGIGGFIFYCFIILKGILAAINLRKDVFFYPFAFIVVYLSICNFAEDVIISSTSSFSLLFWLSWFVLNFHTSHHLPSYSVSTVFESTHNIRVIS